MFKRKNALEEPSRRYSFDAPFEIVEAYNSLVSNLLRICSDKGYKSIGITSASYGEGKSTVAIDLANALADNLINKRILLVDSDLRRSSVSTVMCNDDIKGLSNFLADDSSDPGIIKTDIDNLDLLSAGDVKANPAGLLRSDKMGELLSRLEAVYDFIIIDTPPVNDYADALFLADRVSGFIFATKKKVSTVSSLDVATSRMETSGATILGIVYSE